MTRLFTPDGGEIVAFTSGDPPLAIVRRGTYLTLVEVDGLEVVDPDELARMEWENARFTASRRALTPYAGPGAHTNAIGGPQTGRGVR